MTDPRNIVKAHVDTPDEALAKAKARGAWIIDPNKKAGMEWDETLPADDYAQISHPGCDFTGDPEQLRHDNPEVQDLRKRMEDASNQASDPLAAELAAKYHEENQQLTANRRFKFQEEFMAENWVPGRVLHVADLLVKLQSIRGDFFLAEDAYLGLRGLGYLQNNVPTYCGVALQDGWSPEWSQLRTDAHGNPTKERFRGWRTVLLVLIQKFIITEDQCDATFGKPSGPRSRPWYRSLYAVRNGVCGECHKAVCHCGADQWTYLRSDAHRWDIPEAIAAGKRQEIIPPGEQRIICP
jgi:hypothetical protein